jgi:hypothetical protein
MIVDWAGTALQVRAGLLDTAIRSGNFAELSIWTVSLSTAEKRLLTQRGFGAIDAVDDPSQDMHIPHVFVRPIDPEKLDDSWVVGNRDLHTLENWSLRAIYSDGN